MSLELPPAQSIKILVVDDQPYDALLSSKLLKEQLYQVQTANNGEAALHIVHAWQPDIVLSDVMMPVMNGFELCRRIKSNANTVLTPVVLITALEDRSDRIYGIQAGADEFLSKPIHREELMARVRSLLRHQQIRKQLEQAQREQLQSTFKRYIAPSLVDEILHHPEKAEQALNDRQTRQHGVVLFSDLRGFTAMSETLQPAQVVALLNEFFTVLTEIAYQYEGTIFNMAGDCLLIGFGLPFQQSDAAQRAVLASIAMQEKFLELAKSWRARGIYQGAIGLGIGINQGDMIVGNVGSANYMNYTVIGDTVNVAARLTGVAGKGEIILSDSLYQDLNGFLPQRPIKAQEPVRLKGKAQPVRIYKIVITGD